MKFIVIDGLDGSGKDTQVQLIADAFKKEGKNVVVRSHPNSDNHYGQKSKESLMKNGKINHLKATVYFALDVIRSIVKFYKKDNIDVLIFSRYILAVVYLPNVINIIIYKLVAFILPTSKYMFFLDASPQVLLNRINKRGEDKEMFENLEELEKAREKSKKVLDEWNIISAEKSVTQINNEIKNKCFD